MASHLGDDNAVQLLRRPRFGGAFREEHSGVGEEKEKVPKECAGARGIGTLLKSQLYGFQVYMLSHRFFVPIRVLLSQNTKPNLLVKGRPQLV